MEMLGAPSGYTIKANENFWHLLWPAETETLFNVSMESGVEPVGIC